MGSILIILAIMFIITFVHEGGHYIASRYFGVKPDLFEIGKGPVIIKTGILRIRLVPVTGKVNLPDSEIALLPPIYEKWIAAAGPLSNLIATAVLALVILFNTGVQVLFLMCVASFVMGVGNLIPMKLNGLKSDGAYVFDIF